MAGLNRRGLKKDAKGVSDVLGISFMFLLAIFAGVLLHAYKSDAIDSAVNRHLYMKAEYLYKTLELSQVENYSLTYFRAIAENLIAENLKLVPVVPGDYLRQRMGDLLAYLCPPNHGVLVEVTRENAFWKQLHPSHAQMPSERVTQFSFLGKLTIIVAEAGENRLVQKNAAVTIFKI